jgi:benzoyl-CoA reductase/2-hydroxyglutaryl-CoA dehydratase subunit BcrC/BadD/HgdB
MMSLITKFREQALAKLNKKNTVGYFCSYVPAEIIEANGFIPVRLAGLGDGTAENEGERFLHSEACSFCKESLGAKSLALPLYNNIKRLIIPSGCDQMKRHGEKWSIDFGTQTFHLFTPATWEDPSSQNIYWQEIKWLNDELSAIAPKKNNLKDIVRQYNEARKRVMRLTNLLSYNDSFNLMHLFFVSPISDFLSYLDEIEKTVEPKPLVCHSEPFVCHSERSEESQDKLREESHSRIIETLRSAQGDMPMNDKIRLLIVGSPIGYGDNFIQKALEKYPNATIVYDATCTGNRFIEIDIPLSGDIIANIASAYFNRPPCVWRRPNSGFYQYIKKVVDKYRVQGVIYKTLKFCDLWKYEAKRFKDWVNLPVIQIENTYSPAQNAQISKRIAAFLETFK